MSQVDCGRVLPFLENNPQCLEEGICLFVFISNIGQNLCLSQPLKNKGEILINKKKNKGEKMKEKNLSFTKVVLFDKNGEIIY